MTMAETAATTAEDALRRYCETFAARDLDGVLALFDEQALVEIPLLPQRLFGRDELQAAMTGVLGSMRSCTVELVGVVGDGTRAMGEGRLEAEGDGAPDLAFSFGIVVETRDGLIVRLTEYFDTDPILPLD